MLNTTTGMLFSLHSVTAVLSITAMLSSLSISSKLISGMSRASGFFTGSSLYTPSTLVAFRRQVAPISAALSAAQVSVVKKGLPVPAPKITTRPFSRWRMHLLLM